MSANGTFSENERRVFTDPNALKRTTKISRMLSGTMTLSRAMARCWFSNSPPQVV